MIVLIHNMKKKSDTKPGDGVYVYHEGRNDAEQNLGNHSGKYRGHLKKCYKNGYAEGQMNRSSWK